MRLCCGLMDGQIWEAALQPVPEGGPEATPMVVLSNEEVLSPADADVGEFTIVEATEDERGTLKQAGYGMPDWDPAQWSGCAACHGEHAEGEARSEGAAEPAP